MASVSAAIPAALGEAHLEARYFDRVEAPSAWNQTLDTLLSHRSVRAYLPDPLPEGSLELIVAAAQSAASSSNLQPWSVVAVEDGARKARLAELAGGQQHIRDAPVFLAWLIDLHRLARIGELEQTPAGALDYLESFVVGVVDTALAAQNAVVALESLGLGAVYIGALRNRPTEVAAELGLPPHVFALFGLVVGRPDPARPAAVKPRLPREAVLFREGYGSPDQQANAVAAYNQRFRAFQRGQALPERDWSEVVAQRLRGPEALHGREHLRRILGELGFPLR
jgi:nitroreductase